MSFLDKSLTSFEASNMSPKSTNAKNKGKLGKKKQSDYNVGSAIKDADEKFKLIAEMPELDYHGKNKDVPTPVT